jgi:hypothetical protein
MKIRLSPSGPVVENSGGGPFEPGTGAMLRLAEGTTTIGGSLALSTDPLTIGTQLGGGTVLVETLLLPNAELNYRATLLLDVVNTNTNTVAEVQLFLDTSVDGTNWVEQVANVHVLGAGSGIDGGLASARQVRLDMTLRAGSALSGGMAADSPSLRVRGRIAVAAGGSSAVVNSDATSGSLEDLTGTALLQLSEHF